MKKRKRLSCLLTLLARCPREWWLIKRSGFFFFCRLCRYIPLWWAFTSNTKHHKNYIYRHLRATFDQCLLRHWCPFFDISFEYMIPLQAFFVYLLDQLIFVLVLLPQHLSSFLSFPSFAVLITTRLVTLKVTTVHILLSCTVRTLLFWLANRKKNYERINWTVYLCQPHFD